MTFGAAAAPLILGVGGAALPPIWWLTKTILPKLNIVPFPGYEILKDIETPKQKANSAPLWQRLLVTTMVAGFVLANADPKWKDDIELGHQDGPVVLVIDNDWAAAQNWEDKQERIQEILDLAERKNRPVIIMKTAPEGKDNQITISDPLEVKKARAQLSSLTPQSWPTNRTLSSKALEKLHGVQNPSIFWFSNGLDYGQAVPFAKKLEKLGPVTLFDDQTDSPMLLSLKQTGQSDLVVTAQRGNSEEQEDVTVTAFDKSGNAIHQEKVIFKEGQTTQDIKFDIPPELRRQLVKISIANEKTAGATVLLDENWRQKSVGIIESSALHPLLSGQNYVQQAISPFTDLHSGSVNNVIKSDLSVIILTDEVSLTGSESEKLEQWVKKGGTLLRFAGPKLAAKPDDPLLPVSLLPGEDHTGSDFSGEKAVKLSHFEEDTPFYGLKVPDDLKIQTRILPDPTSDLDDKIWAQFEDGSPLVTSDKKGKGRIVLVHTTANLDWSNMAISGSGDLFVNMMKTVIFQSQNKNTKVTSLNRALPPLTTLDHQGKLRDVVSSALPLDQKSLQANAINAHYPPGFYGDDTTQTALNVYHQTPKITDLSMTLENKTDIKEMPYQNANNKTNWKAYLLLGAAFLIWADTIARLRQGGKLGGRRRRQKRKADKDQTLKAS